MQRNNKTASPTVAELGKVLKEFLDVRIAYYEIRKKALLDDLEFDLLKLDNKVRFILGVVEGEIILFNRVEAKLFLELQEKGFTPFSKKSKGIDVNTTRVTDETDESKESPKIVKGVKRSDYDYLLSMPLQSLTMEKIQELCAEKAKLENMEELRRSLPSSLWTNDLDALEKELDELERQVAEAEVRRLKIKEKIGNDGIAVAKEAKKE